MTAKELDQLDRIERKLDEVLKFKAELQGLLAAFGTNGKGFKVAAALLKGK